MINRVRILGLFNKDPKRRCNIESPKAIPIINIACEDSRNRFYTITISNKETKVRMICPTRSFDNVKLNAADSEFIEMCVREWIETGHEDFVLDDR